MQKGSCDRGRSFQDYNADNCPDPFEYSEDGGFEDRATQMVCNRDFPVPEFRVSDGGEELHIYTKDLEIHYDRQKFSPSGLMIRVAGGKASERVWHYGDEPKDLLGTARTLDEADGEIPLSHGIMSRNGFQCWMIPTQWLWAKMEW